MSRRGKTVAPPASGVERKNRRVAALSPTSVAFVSGGVENYKLHTFELPASKFAMEPK